VYQTDIVVFNFEPVTGRIRGEEIVHVQFQGVCPGLFDLAGIVNPTTVGIPVEAADDRDIERFFCALEMSDIFFRPDAITPSSGR
jgi:hypothetical protein